MDDEYPTCARTYTTLRIYPGQIDPSLVTQRLGIEPSKWQRAGEPMRKAGRTHQTAPIHGWFLCSRGHVDSTDSGRHLDWLLDRLTPRLVAVLLRSWKNDLSRHAA